MTITETTYRVNLNATIDVHRSMADGWETVSVMEHLCERAEYYGFEVQVKDDAITVTITDDRKRFLWGVIVDDLGEQIRRIKTFD